MTGEFICKTTDETFSAGRQLGAELEGGDVVLLFGGLGAGKTLFTKGILDALDFDIDEVRSPSFSLVNLYKTPALDVYHIDLWRIDPMHDPAAAVGLEDILEQSNSVAIIEWADRLGEMEFPNRSMSVEITGDGDAPRRIVIQITQQIGQKI